MPMHVGIILLYCSLATKNLFSQYQMLYLPQKGLKQNVYCLLREEQKGKCKSSFLTVTKVFAHLIILHMILDQYRTLEFLKKGCHVNLSRGGWGEEVYQMAFSPQKGLSVQENRLLCTLSKEGREEMYQMALPTLRCKAEIHIATNYQREETKQSKVYTKIV